MKAKLDFEHKTIEFECEPTLKDVAELQKALKDWQKWRIVGTVMTVSVPSVWYPTYPQYPTVTYIGTSSDDSGITLQ